MSERQQYAPKSVYLLADHLDAILAAAEDLLTLHTDFDPGELLRLELTAITHVLQARNRIQELRFADPPLADPSLLFIAGTDVLDVREPTNAKISDERRHVTKDYLIGRRISIRLLVALATDLLDALEYSFVLYENRAAEATVAFSVPEIWSTTTPN